MNPESTSFTCPQCHAPLPADAPQELCPACLMAVASMATDQDTLPLTAADLPELADIAAAFPELEIIEKSARAAWVSSSRQGSRSWIDSWR